MVLRLYYPVQQEFNISHKGHHMNSNQLPCGSCKGQGYTVKTNILKARQEKVMCPTCHGTGKIYVENVNGIMCQSQMCQVMYWQDFVNNEPVATLHIHVCPIMDKKTGRPAFNPNIFDPTKKVPRIFLQIVHMATKEGYKKQGRMNELLMRATEDRKIEWVETSWDDSSEEGRAFLLKRQFVREKGKLIWRRGNPDAN